MPYKGKHRQCWQAKGEEHLFLTWRRSFTYLLLSNWQPFRCAMLPGLCLFWSVKPRVYTDIVRNPSNAIWIWYWSCKQSGGQIQSTNIVICSWATIPNNLGDYAAIWKFQWIPRLLTYTLFATSTSNIALYANWNCHFRAASYLSCCTLCDGAFKVLRNDVNIKHSHGDSNDERVEKTVLPVQSCMHVHISQLISQIRTIFQVAERTVANVRNAAEICEMPGWGLTDNGKVGTYFQNEEMAVAMIAGTFHFLLTWIGAHFVQRILSTSNGLNLPM